MKRQSELRMIACHMIYTIKIFPMKLQNTKLSIMFQWIVAIHRRKQTKTGQVLIKVSSARLVMHHVYRSQLWFPRSTNRGNKWRVLITQRCFGSKSGLCSNRSVSKPSRIWHRRWTHRRRRKPPEGSSASSFASLVKSRVTCRSWGPTSMGSCPAKPLSLRCMVKRLILNWFQRLAARVVCRLASRSAQQAKITKWTTEKVWAWVNLRQMSALSMLFRYPSDLHKHYSLTVLLNPYLNAEVFILMGFWGFGVR